MEKSNSDVVEAQFCPSKQIQTHPNKTKNVVLFVFEALPIVPKIHVGSDLFGFFGQILGEFGLVWMAKNGLQMWCIVLAEWVNAIEGSTVGGVVRLLYVDSKCG